MQGQSNNRKRAAEKRANRRSVTWVALGGLLGLLLFGSALLCPPTCLTTQQVAAQVLRGEKIGNLSVVTESNLPTTTNSNPTPAALLSGGTNKLGLPLAAAVTNSAPRSVAIGGDKYQMISFGQLAGFLFKVSPEILSMETESSLATGKVLEQIPADIKKLNEQAVALTGFMLPVKLNEGLVTDFMLLPNTLGCCYGRMPRINEVIIVNTTGRGFKQIKDVPITVAGTFHVGAIRNDNRLIGIYQLDCEQVVEAATLNAP